VKLPGEYECRIRQTEVVLRVVIGPDGGGLSFAADSFTGGLRWKTGGCEGPK